MIFYSLILIITLIIPINCFQKLSIPLNNKLIHQRIGLKIHSERSVGGIYEYSGSKPPAILQRLLGTQKLIKKKSRSLMKTKVSKKENKDFNNETNEFNENEIKEVKYNENPIKSTQSYGFGQSNEINQSLNPQINTQTTQKSKNYKKNNINDLSIEELEKQVIQKFSSNTYKKINETGDDDDDDEDDESGHEIHEKLKENLN